MRKLVVFYSLEGNTRLAAKTIAEASGADIMELIPLSQPSSEGFSRFLRGGKSAVKKEIPELEPFGVNPDDYEMIFLGSPVWAWTFTPAVRAFLEKHDLSGKKVAIFMCHGGGPGKAPDKLRSAVSGSVIGELLLRDPLRTDSEAQLKKASAWASDMSETAQILS